MCGKNIKRGLSGLLLCWLCLAPGTGQAAEYTITPAQLQEWKQYNEQQTQIISDLQQRTLNSSASVQSLQRNLHEQAAISKNLKESNEKLIALQNQSTQIIEQQAQTLTEQRKLIDEQKSLLTKLKKQRSKHWGVNALVLAGGDLPIEAGGGLSYLNKNYSISAGVTTQNRGYMMGTIYF